MGEIAGWLSESLDVHPGRLVDAPLGEVLCSTNGAPAPTADRHSRAEHIECLGASRAGGDMSAALTEDVQVLRSGLSRDEPEIEVRLRLPRESAKKVLELLDAEQTTGALVLPTKQELTTTQAAKTLGMSRPTLMQLMSVGRISFRKWASTTAFLRRRFRSPGASARGRRPDGRGSRARQQVREGRLTMSVTLADANILISGPPATTSGMPPASAHSIFAGATRSSREPPAI